MTNIVPGALWKPIDVGNRAARRKGRGLIGHIAVVNSTLLIPGPLSTRPSDWHFYLPKNPYPTGERFAQLIDLDLQSWSSADGNATCPSFESEGGVGTDVGGPWTANQVEGAAMILAHLHKTEGVPLQDMVNSLPTSRGFAVHRYGIDPYRVAGGELWSKAYAKACPGDARVGQVGAIVARAQQLVNGDDMSYSQWPKADRDFLLNDIRDSVLLPVLQQWWGAVYNSATHHGSDEDNGIGHPISAHKYAKEARDLIAAFVASGGGTSAGAVLASLSDADVARIAKATADENARRQVS